MSKTDLFKTDERKDRERVSGECATLKPRRTQIGERDRGGEGVSYMDKTLHEEKGGGARLFFSPRGEDSKGHHLIYWGPKLSSSESTTAIAQQKKTEEELWSVANGLLCDHKI